MLPSAINHSASDAPAAERPFLKRQFDNYRSRHLSKPAAVKAATILSTSIAHPAFLSGIAIAESPVS